MTADHVVVCPPVLYFGTPVALVSTRNQDGSANLAPMSSLWFLGRTVVLGLGRTGQTLANLQLTGECVINLPSADQVDLVESLAPLTGRHPVPEHKRATHRYEPRKFAAASATELPSDVVEPPRVAECPVHLEAVVEAIHAAGEESFFIVDTRIVRVHVKECLMIPGTQHVDTDRWSPLFYVFRHYFGSGSRLARNFRAET